MTMRETWKTVRRAVRLMRNGHKVAAEAAMRQFDEAATALVVPAVMSRNDGHCMFALEASRNAARNGRSFSTAVRLNSAAVRYRAAMRRDGLLNSKHYGRRPQLP